MIFTDKKGTKTLSSSAERALKLALDDFKLGMTKFVAMFTNNYNLRLVFKGTDCAVTDGTTIIVPEVAMLGHQHMSIEEKEAALDFLMSLRGYIYHECSHVLHSDFETASVAHKDGGSALHRVCNVLEDNRVEALTGHSYPGAKESFTFLNEWSSKRALAFLDEQAEKLAKRGQPLVLDQFGQMLSCLFLIGNRSESASHRAMYDKYIDADIKAWSEERRELIEQATVALTTPEVLEIAKQILGEWEEETKKKAKECVEAPATVVGAFAVPGSGKALADFAENVRERALSHIDDIGYLVADTSSDRIYVPGLSDSATKKGENRKYVSELLDSVRSSFGVVERQLRGLLQTYTSQYEVGGLDDGEVDDDELYKLASKTSDAIFKEVFRGMDLTDTAVALTVDVSGSMQGYGERAKYRLATQAALVFGHCLDAIKVPFEVTCWSTDGDDDPVFDKLRPEDRRLYSRFAALDFRLLKQFDESWPLVMERMAHLQPGGCNYDGESVKLAAQRLLSRKEKRKVLFVFSDGLPSGVGRETSSPYDGRHRKYLHTVIDMVRTAGIELVGIGIMSPETDQYYRPSFVNVDNVTDLPGVVLKQLKAILLPGVR